MFTLLFLGDGVAVFETYIHENCTVPYTFAPAHVNKQRAGAVAALGEIYYTEGKTETAEEHKPDYLRLSQAEREREERLKNVESAFKMFWNSSMTRTLFPLPACCIE